MKRKRVIYGISIGILSLALLFVISALCVFVFIYRDINFEGDELLFERSGKYESTTLYAKDKNSPEDYVAVEQLSGFSKIYYPLDEIPEHLKRGIISVEDKIFYEHGGVDVKRSILAAMNYIFGQGDVFGASTLTQQVIKNISGDSEQTVRRKLTEIIRAYHIEKRYEKDEILELYLNVIPFGENSYGVGAASRAYFGKEPYELTPAESAALIGITNAPSAYNPYSNPDLCKKKRDIVLSVMRDDGVITDEEYNTAKGTNVDVIARESREGRNNSWFCEVAIDDAVKALSEKYNITESASRLMLSEGGFSIYTTMDTEVQRILEEYFENTDNFPSEIYDGLNYAMAVTDVQSGHLCAVVGRVGEKRGNRLLNHATSPHTPGSVLKPIALYAPLIDSGLINSATVLDDVPVTFSSGREYPKNSPNVYDGLITVKDAIRLSKNTVAVRLCNMRTPRAIYDSLCRDYGFTSLVEKESLDGRVVTDIATAPMALGQLTHGVSILKLTESYGVFCADGAFRPARSFTRIVDYEGETVIEYPEEERRIMKPETARIMNTLLMGVVENGTAGRITLGELVETAGKTGTSGNNRDKMFVGYTPYYTAGIWCGYDGGGKDVSSLSRSHLEIWDDVMREVHTLRFENEATVMRFSREGLIEMSFCMDSGERYSDVCHYDPRGNRRDVAYFTYDNRPNEDCERHVLCLYDTVSKGISLGNCPRRDLVAVSLLRIDNRSFPKEIYITDAEYVYRDMPEIYTPENDPTKPYFYPSVPEGEYVGISDRKRQFNCACDLH